MDIHCPDFMGFEFSEYHALFSVSITDIRNAGIGRKFFK